MYARCTLGRSCRRRFTLQTADVTFENGRRREPYPPATVSLLTNPSFALRSASTIRMTSPQRRRLARRTQAQNNRRASSHRPRRVEQVMRAERYCCAGGARVGGSDAVWDTVGKKL